MTVRLQAWAYAATGAARVASGGGAWPWVTVVMAVPRAPGQCRAGPGLHGRPRAYVSGSMAHPGQRGEHLAPVVDRVGDQVRDVGGAGQQARIARPDRGPQRQEHHRRRRDRPPVPGRGAGFARPELPGHQPDRRVQQLHREVRPGQGVALPAGLGVPAHRDVLAQPAAPTSGRAGGLPQLPPGQPARHRRGEVGAVDGHRPEVGEFAGSRTHRPQRTGPGRPGHRRGAGPGPGATSSSPSPPDGAQFHDARTPAPDRYAAYAASSRRPASSVNHTAGSGPYAAS